MKIYQKIIFASFSIISLILVLCLKSLPSGQLWKNFNILYVPSQADDNVVVNAIESSGITDAVILKNQYLPTLLPEKSPEIAMYKLNSSLDSFSYSSKRNNFFYDKSKNYRLYYIPSEHKSKLSQIASVLHSKGISVGIDSTSAYPWFLPVICILIAVVLCYFSVNRFVFCTGVFIPLIFVYCNPFYPAAIGNLLYQLVVFFASNIWKRKGYLSCLLKNYFLLGIFAVSLICPFACSLKSGLLFLVCAAGSLSLIYDYELVNDFFKSKNIFNPVYIRPAKTVSIYANKQKKVLSLLTGGVFVIFIICVLSLTNVINISTAKVQLPAAKGFSSEELPDLEEYCRWNWNVKTYPYKSINKMENPDEVNYHRFVENNGIVTEAIQTMQFNQDFKNEALQEIENFPFDSIEKVLVLQGKDVNPGYAVTTSYQIGIFGIIMCLCGLFVLLFLYISTMIRKGAKK